MMEMNEVNGILIKETKDAYYYNNFILDKYYIIRWLNAGGYHFYPCENGKLPDYFKTEEDAKNYLEERLKNFNGDYNKHYKVVNGKEACKYPVPKRW